MFLCGWFLSTVLLLFLRARQEFQCWWVFFLLAILYVKWKSLSLSFFLSRFWPFATTGTIQFMEFSRPEYFEQVAFPFSRGSSWPRNWTRVSCIAGRFFTNWAIREVFSNFGNESRRSHHLKYFLPICGLSFHFAYCFPCYAKAFDFK